MTEYGTAEFLKHNELDSGGAPWKVDARLYRLFPPYEWTYTDYEADDNPEKTISVEYVVVSAADLPKPAGPETYIFAADESGEWLVNWEMPGSQKFTLNHHEVLKELGYLTDSILDEVEALGA